MSQRKKPTKAEVDEAALIDSFEKGEWRPAGVPAGEKARLARAAAATLRKDRRVNLRISSRDLDAIKKRALIEGLPYQTLISSVIHKYAAGRLREVDG